MLSCYLTASTLCVSYYVYNQSVNAVKYNSRCELWESSETYRYTAWTKCREFSIKHGDT